MRYDNRATWQHGSNRFRFRCLRSALTHKGTGKGVFAVAAGRDCTSDKGTISSSVYAIVAAIPVGKVTTYGQIAAILGRPGAARSVVWALHSLGQSGAQLPYHRVVNQAGRLAPAHIFGDGVQRVLLENEGVTFCKDGSVVMTRHLWSGL